MKTAIFGGAFDPFHTEHKNIIVNAKKYLQADRVVVVPSYMPPHKEHLCSPYAVRRAMVQAGTADLPYVVIDDIEEERGQVNPTSVTLPILKEKYGDVVFVVGGDSIKNFHTWINPQKIVEVATLAAVERASCASFSEDVANLEKRFGTKVAVVPYVGKNVSSSRIKAEAELGLAIGEVDAKVEKIIKENRLYRKFTDKITALKNDIAERTYNHCVSTVLYGEDFAGINKLTYEEVFLACLFHDCAKNLDAEMAGVPKPVVHQFTGAERAERVYGITDKRILDAIRYHTSGKPNMTRLEKLTFSADMLEPNRNFDGVTELRQIMDRDFEEGFRACVFATYKHLVDKGGEIYPLTKECAEYYNRKNSIEE